MTRLDRETSNEQLPQECMDQAQELARGAEVLPDGVTALAKRIHWASKQNRQLRVKLGVDPTSTDLHLGHAVVFRKLKRFQDFGHQVVLIIGGFTAQIGDPTGRNTTRPPLSYEEVQANAQTYISQMGLILDIEKTEVLDNADWLAPMNLNDVLKLAGRVTANQLLAKESFAARLDKGLPIGFHEMFYPLLQGYDSIAVRSDIELGGTDQRFNILQGRELQLHYEQEPQLAMLLPLLEGTDGVQKMSKSFNNYIGLREAPDDMFGKCMRIPDELLVKYFELTTILSGKEIDEVNAFLDGGGNPKEMKEKLAGQIVLQYHGQLEATRALAEWRRVHSQRLAPDEMPSFTMTEPKPLFRLLVDTGLAPGTAEAKRLCKEGAVRIDGAQASDPNMPVPVPKPEPCVLQVGRRKFVKVVAPGP